MEMDPKTLKQICRSLDLYQTPELNDKLYLHYKGFTHIQNLEPYTGLKVLYLEGNAIDRPTNLDHLSPVLKCLYLQENLIADIEDLALAALHTLNLNQNCLAALTSKPLVVAFPSLHTLSVQHNKLVTGQSLQCLRDHPSLAVLDLSYNKLSSEKCPMAELLSLLQSLPSLRVLYLKGNDLVTETHQYRKTVIAALPSLTYLDDRPVFDEERRLTLAWSKGGIEAERAEQQLLRQEAAEKQFRQWEQFDLLANKGDTAERANVGEKEEKVQIVDDDAETNDDSENEIGANDDIDSDDDDIHANFKQSMIEEAKSNAASKHSAVSVTEISDDIDELTLTDRSDRAKHAAPVASGSAWSSDKPASALPSKTFLTQPSRASIELVDEDDEPQPSSESLTSGASTFPSLISELD